jgi:hypothetical protein
VNTTTTTKNLKTLEQSEYNKERIKTSGCSTGNLLLYTPGDLAGLQACGLVDGMFDYTVRGLQFVYYYTACKERENNGLTWIHFVYFCVCTDKVQESVTTD